MNSRNISASRVVVAVLLVAGVALVASELLALRSSRPAAIADPCASRAPFSGSGLDATVQRVVLDGLDGAACRLGVSRERLVLGLAGDSSQRLRGGQATTNAAVRAGLLRALDEAAGRGDVPAFLTPALRRLVQTVPIDALIRGAVSLRDLVG